MGLSALTGERRLAASAHHSSLLTTHSPILTPRYPLLTPHSSLLAPLSPLLLALLVCLGCGTSHVPLSGRVTLDDAPLAEALVAFVPETPGLLPLVARTDAEGRYVLHERPEKPGVAPGKYQVRISTYSEGIPDADPPEPTIPERVPARYNRDTILIVTVEAGRAAADFDLRTSDGPVVQP